LKIESLNLQNFKNLTGEFQFSDGINLIIGQNGKGKTNILEAIHFLTIGSSFRNLEDKEILGWEDRNMFSRISGQIFNPRQKLSSEFSLIIADDIGIFKKRFEIDGLRKKKNEYLFSFPSILFHPHDIEILVGSPDQRRNELDKFLSLISPEYSKYTIQYRKILKNRNQLLKKVRSKEANKNELGFWNDELIETGSRIISDRVSILESFVPTVRKFAKEIFRDNFDNLKIEYISKIAKSADNREKIRSNFASKIHSGLDREILSGQTLYGPQRDDLLFINDTIDLHKFGSRGQQRLVSLIFKLAMWKYYLDVYEDNPVLLLDDMMSELDFDHREKLSSALLDTPAQIIFTSTTLDDFSSNLRERAKNSLLRI
jgi:DNA replication and repair protein RecF